MSVPLLTACALLPLLALLLQLLWLGRGRPGARSAPQPSAEEMRRHLLWGLFYVNPDDPRGWVPKLIAVGKTVNFRARGGVYLFLALLGATLASSLVMLISAL
jgi:uncharacterized membrane protein